MTSRWYGKIGLLLTREVRRGVWKSEIEEHEYRGEIITFSRSWQNQSYSTNDNISINAKISIIADGYLDVNCASIRYAELMGTLWKVTEIHPEEHRLILTLGGVYNGTNE